MLTCNHEKNKFFFKFCVFINIPCVFRGEDEIPIIIKDKEKGTIKDTLPARSMQTFIYW